MYSTSWHAHYTHGLSSFSLTQSLIYSLTPVGLDYFAEFEARIPREEVAEIEAAVREILPEIDEKLIITICGSYRYGFHSVSFVIVTLDSCISSVLFLPSLYRRKKATCGDIDMLLTHPDYPSDKPTPKFFRQLVQKRSGTSRRRSRGLDERKCIIEEEGEKKGG